MDGVAVATCTKQTVHHEQVIVVCDKLSAIRRVVVRVRSLPPGDAGMTLTASWRGGWRREILAAGVASAALLRLLAIFTTLKTEETALYRDPGWDRHVYRLMAEGDPFQFGLAPFNHRVLLPLIAKVLPFSLQTNFMMVTVIAAWSCGVGIFLLGRAHGLSPALALGGMFLFFSMGWGMKFAVADFWVPDALVLAFVIAALMAVKGNAVAFAVIVAGGCLVKESMLFVIPLFYTVHAKRLYDRDLLRRTILSALPAVAIMMVLFLAIPARNREAAYFASLPADFQRYPELYNHYDYRDLLHNVGYLQRYRLRGDFDTWVSYSFDPFGLVAPLLAAVALRSHWRTIARYAPFVFLVYFQLLFATDTQRLLTLAAPLVCVWAMLGAEELRRITGLPDVAAMAICIGAFALILIDPEGYETPMWGEFALVGLLAIACLATWARTSLRRRDVPATLAP